MGGVFIGKVGFRGCIPRFLFQLHLSKGRRDFCFVFFFLIVGCIFPIYYIPGNFFNWMPAVVQFKLLAWKLSLRQEVGTIITLTYLFPISQGLLLFNA